MGKKILVILVVMAVGLNSNAQLFKYGGDLGLNLAGLDSDGFESTSLTGFQAGIIVELKLPVLLGVEMDLKYSQKGARIGTENMALQYIDVPIVAKFYMLKILSFQVGPQYSHLLGAKMGDLNIKDNLNASDFSAVIGFGFDAFNIHASARFNFGLTNISKNGGDELTNRWYQVSLGYWFSKRNGE